ncbi:MAG: ABC transporter permease, partial [Myxococcota bacterium]
FGALAVVRDLAPIISSSMVAAKAGTEMASQIAVMRTREQIDALEVMAVNPLWWLVTPRLLAIVIVMPALTIVAIFVTILASWAVATFQLGLNGHEFLEFVRGSIDTRDLVACELKGMVFGVVICLVSCYFGFTSRKGPEGVGQATNAAVVVSSVVCVSINYLVSQVLYG